MLLSSGALIILIALSACEKKVTVVEGPKQSNLMTLLANNVLFNTDNTQDFQTALAIADTINFSNSSDKNNICPLMSSYFEEIDFPKDTKEYLNNLYEQVKPSFQVIKLKK